MRRFLRSNLAIWTVLAALLFAYMGALVDASLLYERHGAVFLANVAFLRPFLHRPGGPAEYVSRVLLQVADFRWLGALTFTLVAALICLSTAAILRAAAGRRVNPAFVAFPALLLLALYGRYDFRPHLDVALLATLVCVCAYAWMPRGRLVVRWGLLAALSVIVYAVAGGLVILFGLLCALIEIFERRRWVTACVALVMATALPFVHAWYSYPLDVTATLSPLLPWFTEETSGWSSASWVQAILHVALLLYFPAAMVWVGLGRDASDAQGSADEVDDAQPGRTGVLQAWSMRSVGVVLVLGTLLVLLTRDADKARRIRIAREARLGHWTNVLRMASKLPAEAFDQRVLHDVNMALYRSGKLSSDLLCFPQRPGMPMSWADLEHADAEGFLKYAQFALAIGQFNMATRHAHMALEAGGPHPEVLKLLARCYVAEGNVPAAKIVLNVLADNPLYAGWARRTRTALEEDPKGTRERLVGEACDVTVKKDIPSGGGWEATYLDMLDLTADSDHPSRMAFEYRMAMFLLHRSPGRIVANLPRARKLGYKELPALWEEAALYYQALHADQKLDLAGWEIHPMTRRRFAAFGAELAQHTAALEAKDPDAIAALAPRWGTTYFYYAIAGHSEPRPGWKIESEKTNDGRARK